MGYLVNPAYFGARFPVRKHAIPTIKAGSASKWTQKTPGTQHGPLTSISVNVRNMPASCHAVQNRIAFPVRHAEQT